MLQLLEDFARALAPLAILAAVMVALVQSAQAYQNLKLPPLPAEMWPRARRAIGCALWFTFSAALTYGVLLVHVWTAGSVRRWAVIGALVIGIGATGILGVRPLTFDKPGTPRWLKVTAVIGMLYMLGAVAAYEIVTVVQIRTNIKSSCVLRPGGTLAGAVAGHDVRCVDYWLQRGVPANAGFAGDHPLLYVAVAAEDSDARVLTLLLNSGQFDPNMPTADGDTPLHAAVRNSRHDMVCRLIAHGALSHVPNLDSITPLDLARASITPLDLARASPDQDLVALMEGEACLPAERPPA